MTMLTVIGTVRTRTARVLWLLEELGLPYEHVTAGPGSPDVLALNASGKVPVLTTGGITISDSTAIMTFLADREGAFTARAGTLDRARQDSVTQFLLDEVEGPIWAAARHSFILPEAHRVPEVKDSLKWEFGIAATRLAARLGEGPYLMGEDMTVPDIIAVHCLGWARSAKFPHVDPALTAYAERLRARPACKRAMAL